MIPFNRPFLTGSELKYIGEAHLNGQLAGDGHFTAKCSEWLAHSLRSRLALLAHSCTAALEMTALLAELLPGDEVIMPSYTFVSTANAFLLRGAVPVFVDISESTLCIDHDLIEASITHKTRAIVVVHYAGISCDMDRVIQLCLKYNLVLIEDAAQAICSTYKGRPLGGIGDMGCLSFHETKNVISGEGGAIIIKGDSALCERAEIIREKGTNRRQFFRGSVDKYTWVDFGSSYLPGEITAAFLWAQLESADYIYEARMKVWDSYHSSLKEWEEKGVLRRPLIPTYNSHNAHMYYFLVESPEVRDDFISFAKKRGVQCVFHYVPLHSSRMGLDYCSTCQALPVTDYVAERIVRLPMWVGVDQYVPSIVQVVADFFGA